MRYLVLVGLSALFGCTDSTLLKAPGAPPKPLDNRITLEGRFCTDPPSPADFPVRVLFMVDISQSMNVTNPPPPVCNAMMCLSRRGQAVLDVLNAYPGGNGVEYGLISFSSSSSILTQDAMGLGGFTSDDNSVKTKLPTLNMGTGETDYEGALNLAFQMLQADMIKLDATARSRARYVIVFISDGQPAPQTAMANNPQRIVARTNDIAGLQKQERLAEIEFNTIYLNGPGVPLAVQLGAKQLLSDMAKVGFGTFRTFEVGDPLRLFYLDFTSFVRQFQLKRLVVDNVNARPVGSDPTHVDSDGDGLLETDEIPPGTNPLLIDSDGDGFSDLLEVRLRDAGFDPNFPGDADCALMQDRQDDDGDGLLNCEERFIGTNSRLVDSDADGLPDDVELRLGSNPVAADDLTDSDFDGAVNGVEIASHTDPQHDDSAFFSQIAYRYTIAEADPSESQPGQACYDFTVANITLSAPQTITGLLPGTNTVLVRVAATPQDSPTDFGSHYIACVRPRYIANPESKLPPSGKMTLPSTAFKRLSGAATDPEVFNAARDCIVP